MYKPGGLFGFLETQGAHRVVSNVVNMLTRKFLQAMTSSASVASNS